MTTRRKCHIVVRFAIVCLIAAAQRAAACNLPPVAYISNWYRYVRTDALLQLDGSGSHDPDGQIVQWQWSGWPQNAYNISGATTSYFSCRIPTVGTYYIYLGVKDDDGAWDYDYAVAKVHVLSLTAPGYIPVNYDNDNNKLRPLTAVLTTHDGGGEARLSYSGAATIKVYRDVDGNPKGELLTLPWSWPRSHGPVPPLYVEGISVSSQQNDSHLTLSYVRSGSTKDSMTISFTVLNVQITQPDGNPSYDHEFVFTSATPVGTCSVPVSGTTGVPPLDANPNNLKWTLTDKTPLYGANVTFNYSSLPSANSGFGYKDLKLEYTPAGLQSTKTVELFYPKTATNNIYGWRNWPYYWRSGPAAVPDLASFEYETGQQFMGEYKSASDSLIIYDLAADQYHAWSATLYNHFYQATINSGEDGIPDTEAPAGDDTPGTYPHWQGGVKHIGPPDAIAITDGGDGVINTVRYGDDMIIDIPGGESADCRRRW